MATIQRQCLFEEMLKVVYNEKNLGVNFLNAEVISTSPFSSGLIFGDNV